WSPNGELFATGDEFGKVNIRSTTDWEMLWTLEGHSGRIEDLAWSKDSELLASASSDGTVGVWSVLTGKQVHRITEHYNWVNAVEWSPDGKFLATGAEDRRVRIWNHGSWTRVASIECPDWITDIAWAPKEDS